MTGLLLRIGISNLVLSLAIALLAWVVHATGKRPRLAHLLWLLVLLKLVTPPVVTIPVVALPGPTPVAALPAAAPAPSIPPLIAADPSPTAGEASPASFDPSLPVWVWLLGSAWVLVWSLARIFRFQRLLRSAAAEAPPELQRVAAGIAERLGLSTVPAVCTTSAHLSPLVWWTGGRVRVIVPTALLFDLDAGQLEWILAHELAHVRRRDHLVRWLEWLACVTFWWNPAAWWARRNLRANEELCCDALVLGSLKPDPRTYGNSLLAVVEFLAGPTLRPPAMASELASGGFLEKRFQMIASATPLRPTPRWLCVLLLFASIAVLPLGLARAEERDGEAAADRVVKAAPAVVLPPGPGAVGRGESVRARSAGRRMRAGARRDPAHAGMTAVKERIWAAVKAGEIPEQDAKVRWEGYLASLRESRPEARVPTREEMARVNEEIRAGVKDGRISEADAGKRWRAYLERLRGGGV